MIPAVGVALWQENRYLLDRPDLTAVEITYERADDPIRTATFFAGAAPGYVSVHALKLSPANPDPPEPAYLDAVLALGDEVGAAAFSDHLGFTRGGGVELLHFVPPPFTPDALDVTCRNLDVIQSRLGGRPFFVENVATLFYFRGAMTEADFLARVFERTGCGWLLDVTNLYANARNHGFDAGEALAQVLPATPRVQMHLSGGFFNTAAGRYIDSHSRPVPDEVWALYRQALTLGRGKVDAVFLERDLAFPDEAGWLAEVGQARRLAEAVEAGT